MRLKYRKALTPRKRRHVRVRAKVSGTAQRPRLNVFRSSAHIYVQVIDDVAGAHLLPPAISRRPFARRAARRPSAPQRSARSSLSAPRKPVITSVVFDRGGFLYHGRVKAVADGAREGGLEF